MKMEWLPSTVMPKIPPTRYSSFFTWWNRSIYRMNKSKKTVLEVPQKWKNRLPKCLSQCFLKYGSGTSCIVTWNLSETSTSSQHHPRSIKRNLTKPAAGGVRPSWGLWSWPGWEPLLPEAWVVHQLGLRRLPGSPAVSAASAFLSFSLRFLTPHKVLAFVLN